MDQNDENNQFKNPYYSTLVHFQFPYYYYYYPSAAIPSYQINNQDKETQQKCKQEEIFNFKVQNEQLSGKKDDKKYQRYQKRRKNINYKQHKRRKYIPLGIKLTKSSLKPNTITEQNISSLKYYDPYCAFLCTPPFQIPYGKNQSQFCEYQENQIFFNKNCLLKLQPLKDIRDQLFSNSVSEHSPVDEQQFNNYRSNKLATLVKNCKKVQTRSYAKRKIPQKSKKKKIQLHATKQVCSGANTSLLPKKNVIKLQEQILNFKKKNEQLFSHNSQFYNQFQQIPVSNQLLKINMQLK